MIKVTKQKVLTVRKKLKPLLSLKRKYKTTYTDIKKYFKMLNLGIFDNKLSTFNQIEIRELKYSKMYGTGNTI